MESGWDQCQDINTAFGFGFRVGFMGWVYVVGLCCGFMLWVYGWVYGVGLWGGFMGWVWFRTESKSKKRVVWLIQVARYNVRAVLVII